MEQHRRVGATSRAVHLMRGPALPRSARLIQLLAACNNIVVIDKEAYLKRQAAEKPKTR
jgi:hypothetical protein